MKNNIFLKEENSNLQVVPRTSEQPVEIKRKISYVEQDQAFTQVRLGKDELKEYSFLKTKQSNQDFFFLIKIHKKYLKLKQEIEKMEKAGVEPPMLSMIVKEPKQNA